MAFLRGAGCVASIGQPPVDIRPCILPPSLARAASLPCSARVAERPVVAGRCWRGGGGGVVGCGSLGWRSGRSGVPGWRPAVRSRGGPAVQPRFRCARALVRARPPWSLPLPPAWSCFSLRWARARGFPRAVPVLGRSRGFGRLCLPAVRFFKRCSVFKRAFPLPRFRFLPVFFCPF